MMWPWNWNWKWPWNWDLRQSDKDDLTEEIEKVRQQTMQAQMELKETECRTDYIQSLINELDQIRSSDSLAEAIELALGGKDT